MKHDMLDAVWKTARHFRELNLEPPTITLASHDDGMHFLGQMEDHLGGYSNRRVEACVHVTEPLPPISNGPLDNPAEPVKHRTLTLPHCGTFIDGKEPLMEVQWMGIKVRWPAKLMHLPGGRSLWY